MDDSSADEEVGQECTGKHIVIPYADDSIDEEAGEEEGAIEGAIDDDHGTNETFRDSYEEFVEEARSGHDVDNCVNKDDMTNGGNTYAYDSNGEVEEEECVYNVDGLWR